MKINIPVQLTGTRHSLEAGGMFFSVNRLKKLKNGELAAEQKNYNHRLSKKRAKVENVIREIKIFNILSDI